MILRGAVPLHCCALLPSKYRRWYNRTVQPYRTWHITLGILYGILSASGSHKIPGSTRTTRAGNMKYDPRLDKCGCQTGIIFPARREYAVRVCFVATGLIAYGEDPNIIINNSYDPNINQRHLGRQRTATNSHELDFQVGVIEAGSILHRHFRCSYQ